MSMKQLAQYAVGITVLCIVLLAQNTSRYHMFKPNAIFVASQTGNIGNSTLYNVQADVTIKVSTTVTCMSGVASSTVQVSYSWTDGSSTARTRLVPASPLSCAAAGGEISDIFTTSLKGAVNFVGAINTMNSPVYRPSVTIEQIN
jgi:hypothetical protein